LIARYLSSELCGSERALFESHLAACRDCVAFLKTYKATVALTRSFLRAAERKEPPRWSFTRHARR
jgi:anti-sigma factor RsiW